MLTPTSEVACVHTIEISPSLSNDEYTHTDFISIRRYADLCEAEDNSQFHSRQRTENRIQVTSLQSSVFSVFSF